MLDRIKNVKREDYVKLFAVIIVKQRFKEFGNSRIFFQFMLARI